MPYQTIETDELQQLITELNDKKYSYSTIKKAYDLLNAFYRYASAKEQFNNPMLLVSMPKADRVQIESKDIEWFEENEIDLFIKACETRYNTGILKFKYGYILAANIYLGMRGGELLALQWKDIDFDRGTVYVSKTLVQLDNGENKVKFVVQPNTKTYKNRYVPINSKAQELLLKYKENAFFTEPDDYVISTSNRKTNTLKNISDMIQGIEKAAGIDKSSNTHILRHTCASLYFKNGVPVETIAEILGNTREVCEKTYVHFVEEQLQNAASKTVKKIDI
jgi:integrase